MGAFDTGFSWGMERANANAERKQNLSDYELETNIGQAKDNLAGLQQKLSTLPTGSQDYQQTLQAYSSQQQALTALFHPANNPGALQKFGHLIGLGHQSAPATPVGPPTISATPSMEMTAPGAPTATSVLPAMPVDRRVIPMNRGSATPATPGTMQLGDNTLNLPEGPYRTVEGPQTPAQLKAQAQANMVAAATPEPSPSELSPEEAHSAARVKAGLEPKAVVPKPIAPVNPKDVVWLTHPDKTQSPYQFLNGKFVPVEGAEGLTPPVKTPPPSNSQFAVLLRSMFPAVTDGKYTRAQVEEAMTQQKESTSPDTNSTRDVITYDADGNATINELQSSSHKTYGGKGNSGAGGGAAGGRPLAGAHRNTPSQNKANTDVVEATKLNSIAQQVALKPHDAINQKRLAVALERMSAGRFTTQALDYIIKAGWGNTIEQWANNPTTGELPADVVRQLIDGASQNLQAAQDAKVESYKGTTPGQLKDKAKGGAGGSSNVIVVDPKDMH